MTPPRSRSQSLLLSQRWRQLASIAAIIALFTLAGCNGVFGNAGQQNTTNSTVAAVDVPTDQPTEMPAEELAPGLTSEGVSDPGALIDAQRAFVYKHSTVTHANTTISAPNGTAVFTIEQTVRRSQSSNETAYTFNVTGTDPTYTGSSNVSRVDAWETEDRLYTRRSYQNGSVTYNQFGGNAGFGPNPLGAEALSAYIFDAQQGNASVTTRQTNSSPRYLLSGNRMEDNDTTNYRLTIDREGVTHGLLVVRPDYTEVGGSARTHITIEESGMTGELQPPLWLGEARQQTRSLTTSMPTTADETTHLAPNESTTGVSTTENENATTDRFVETATP